MEPAAAPRRCAHCGTLAAGDAIFCPRDGKSLASASDAPVAADPFLGLEIEGQIEIRELIGVGTMGRVYRAFQRGIDRDVAVKLLRPELALNPEAAARFHREARIASRLTHPHLVQVLMSGALDSAAPEIAGTLYLVMEHLDGVSLLSALAAGTDGERALPPARALAITLEVCDAVGDAHRHGIVHRDLKPENVMLIARGGSSDYVKVLDFGIARLVDSRSMWTGAGLIFGSAAYISPEGAMGEQVAPSADVYSIAVVLYECLAGRTPFLSDSPVKLLLSHAQEAPPDLRGLERGRLVPDAIADVVMRNLAKDPRERAQNASELADRLAEAARKSGIDLEPGSPRASARGGARRSARSARISSPTPSPNPKPNPTPKPNPNPNPTANPTPSPGSTPLASSRPAPRGSPAPRGRAWIVAASVAVAAGGAALLARSSTDAFGAAENELHACIGDGQWITPQGRNVRAILERLGRDYPGDPRVRALRLEAGERLLADALRLKYAGQMTEAALRARLAMDLAPELEAAPKLLADLRREHAASASSRPETK